LLDIFYCAGKEPQSPAIFDLDKRGSANHIFKNHQQINLMLDKIKKVGLYIGQYNKLMIKKSRFETHLKESYS